MRELIESKIRSGVIESGRGRYIESSMHLKEMRYYVDGHKTYYARYRIITCSGREMWYGTEFDWNGNLTRRLFNQKKDWHEKEA